MNKSLSKKSLRKQLQVSQQKLEHLESKIKELENSSQKSMEENRQGARGTDETIDGKLGDYEERPYQESSDMQNGRLNALANATHQSTGSKGKKSKKKKRET